MGGPGGPPVGRAHLWRHPGAFGRAGRRAHVLATRRLRPAADRRLRRGRTRPVPPPGVPRPPQGELHGLPEFVKDELAGFAVCDGQRVGPVPPIGHLTASATLPKALRPRRCREVNRGGAEDA